MSAKDKHEVGEQIEALAQELRREPEAQPLFRNEGGEDAARAAQQEMEAIMADYLSFDLVIGA